MSRPRFTHAELSKLDVSDDEVPDSEAVVKTFRHLQETLETELGGQDWYQRYSWSREFSTPYVGPRNPKKSSYVWLGLVDEHYNSFPRASKTLQLEFGVDANAATGFLGRDVLWGILLGRWASDDVSETAQGNLSTFSHLFAQFLADYDEYVLVTKTDEYASPDKAQIEEVASNTDSGLAVTRDLELTELPEIDVFATAWQTLVDLTPLYRVLADITDAPPVQGSVDGPETRATGPDPSAVQWSVDSLAQATSLDCDQIQSNIDSLVGDGCSEEQAIGYVKRYLEDMLRGRGLFSIAGIGPSSGRMLVEAGVTSVDDLWEANSQKLADRTGMSKDRIERFQQHLESGNYKSLEPDNEEVAERLIASGNDDSGWTSSSSTRQTDPTETADRSTDSTQSRSTSSSTERTGGGGDIPSAKPDDETEILPPEQLPVPDEKYTTPDGTTVYPNYLSELYESIQDIKTILTHVFEIPGTNIEPDDLTDPRVQYYVLLDACLGFGDLSSPFTGYGPQHQDRLPFTVDEYREVFGDGRTVTDYKTIAVEPFSQKSHELLRQRSDLSDSKEYVRPCVPGTELPLPELPGTFDELQETMRRLSTFPAYPPLPEEEGNSDRHLPISEIYETCFSTLGPESRVDLAELHTKKSYAPTSPVTEATPTSQSEAESKLVDYGNFTHLHRRVTPPSLSPTDRIHNVFALDWYQPESPSYRELQSLARDGADAPVDTFQQRLRDLVYRRFLLDNWEYDYITVFPGHEAKSLSPQLVELAQGTVVETQIIYTPLLERTQTVERQRNKSEDERKQVAINPSESLRAKAKLDGETVILFDDICTTGSSLVAGSYLLRQAGASRVVGLSLGLTPGGPREAVNEITDLDTVASEIIAGVS